MMAEEAIAIAASIARDPEVDAATRMEALEVAERWRRLATPPPPDELAQRRRGRRTG
jgi:hypothetical protein